MAVIRPYWNRSMVTCIPLILLVLVVMSCTPAAPPTSTSLPPTQPVASATVASPKMATPTLASGGVPASIDEIQRIAPEELKALIEGRADILVVDNQPEAAYEIGHIPGAINFPWATEITEPGRSLPKDKLLVLYCACAHEEDASDVVMQLITKWGYRNIMLLDGGWLRWVELGYPVEEGGD